MAKPVLARSCVNGNATDFGMLKFADMDPNTPSGEDLRKTHPVCEKIPIPLAIKA